MLLSMAHRAVRELDEWLRHNGYARRSHATRVEHLYTYRNKHGSWSDVWAVDTEDAKQQIRARKDAPGTFFTISRVTNVPARERAHARIIHQEPTGRPVFAEHERDHHITTSGRRALTRSQFALGPGPEEKRRGIKGRLPIDTLKRARNALARASQMHEKRHITAGQLAAVRRAVHRAWPSIEED